MEGIRQHEGDKVLLKQLPDKALFVDVETTGLHSTDRVVTLGIVELDLRRLRMGESAFVGHHLIFDPGKKSHPRAEAVHGYSDWTLRHQELFADYSRTLWPKFAGSPLTVAHNAAFDQGFIDREFALAGTGTSLPPFYCTMMAYRAQSTGRSNLNAVIGEMGLRRSGHLHGAMEDAWMAMLVFLNMHGMTVTTSPPSDLIRPTNLAVAPMPVPDPLPRRKKRRAETESITAPPKISTDQQFAIFNAAAPTATMMMRVASADGTVSTSEGEAIALLVQATVERLGIPHDNDVERNIAALLIDSDTSPENVAKAATAIIADPIARTEIGRWIREVTYADGVGSPEEGAAIESLVEAIRAAREGRE